MNANRTSRRPLALHDFPVEYEAFMEASEVYGAIPTNGGGFAVDAPAKRRYEDARDAAWAGAAAKAAGLLAAAFGIKI